MFYTRTTGIPIYVGKGSDSRASSYNSRVKNEDFRTLVAAEGVDIRFELQGVTERQAFRMEVSLIKKYGRLHLGTGTLLNISEGGHGGSQGVTRSEETRKLISAAKKGNNHPNSDKTIWTWYHKNGERIQATAWEMNQLKFNNSRSKAGELIKVFEGGTLYNGKRLYQINGWRLFPELLPRKKGGQAAGRTHHRVSGRIFRWQHVSGITESLTVYDFYNKYSNHEHNLARTSAFCLCKGSRKVIKGWECLNPEKSYQNRR